MIDIPVLFLIFNRPDVTKQVFEAIREARPTRLYIAADGPRRERIGEKEKCEQARQIATQVDWECEVKTLFREENLGCRLAVSGAIDWFFENEPEGIILEDDCLPAPSFFTYCSAMLSLYREDKRVFSVSGSNLSDQGLQAGHGFSRYSLMWGWATWADRWNEYVLEPTDHVGIVLRLWWKRPLVLAYWMLVFRDLLAGKFDTWDYQWILTLWRNEALACRPRFNLIENIGFGDEATHTRNPNSPVTNFKAIKDLDTFKVCQTPVQFDRSLERSDEKVWAGVNLRTIAVLAFPWLKKIKVYIEEKFTQ